MALFRATRWVSLWVAFYSLRLSSGDPPLPPFWVGPAGKRRVALFGHVGNAWCLYPTLIADV